jgi:nucleoside-diphosphate-sugar epimerase
MILSMFSNKKLMKSKIIIPGGAGFIGSHLTESLIEKNHKLSILTRNSTKNIKNIKNLAIVKIDVGNFKKIEKFILFLYDTNHKFF